MPQLRFIDFGAAEDNNHLPLALKIANDGGDVLVDDIEAHVTNRAIIGNVNAPDRPTGFDARAALIEPMTSSGGLRIFFPDGEEATIVGGRTTDVWCMLSWEPPRRGAAHDGHRHCLVIKRLDTLVRKT